MSTPVYFKLDSKYGVHCNNKILLIDAIQILQEAMDWLRVPNKPFMFPFNTAA